MEYLISIEKANEVAIYELKKDRSGIESFATVKKDDDDNWDCSCGMFKMNKKECEHTKPLPNTLVWNGVALSNHNVMATEIDTLSEHDLGILITEPLAHSNWPVDKWIMLNPVKEDVHIHEILDTFGLKEETQFSDLGKGSSHTLSRVSREVLAAGGFDYSFIHDAVLNVDDSIFKERTIEELTAAKEAHEYQNKMLSVAVWNGIKPPKEFSVDPDTWECMCYAAATGQHAILTGPTGSGKTMLIALVAEALDIPFTPFNFGAMTEARTSLIGNTHLNNEGTFFKESRFIKAMRAKNGIILCDEITRAPIDAFNIILPAMDGQGYLSLDEAEEEENQIVERGQFVSFMATANIGMEYSGTDALDRALLDRYAIKVEMSYPEIAEEVRILTIRHPHVQKKMVKKLCEAAQLQRKEAEAGDMVNSISTRMLFDCMNAIEMGLKPAVAIKHTILGCFSSEGGTSSDRNSVMAMSQKTKLLEG